MTKFTKNNQKEKTSRIAFEVLLNPWHCATYEHDVGIDLIVQPFDETEMDPQDGSLRLFEKRFLVQLKSTSEEISVTTDAKVNIDTLHLRDWKRQKDPVMIAKYYIKASSFYFVWVDEIEIKEGQDTQTLYLNYILCDSNKDEVKESILLHLSPPRISPLKYVPNVHETSKGTGYLKIDDIRSGKQIQELFSGGFVDSLEKEMVLKNKIYKLKAYCTKNPDDIRSRIIMVMGLILVHEYDEAARELALIVSNYDNVEAKILFAILEKGHFEILDGLKEYEFVHYLKWRQITPPGTSINAYVIYDGKEKIKLGEYDCRGVLLPDRNFESIQVRFELKTEDCTISPAVYKNVFVMRGLLDSNGELLYEYSQVVRNISAM